MLDIKTVSRFRLDRDRRDQRFVNKERGKRVQLGVMAYEDEKLLLLRLGGLSPTRGFARLMQHLESNAEFQKWIADCEVNNVNN